ncbi:lachesin-like isoform X2 [Planococcus citri]|uniref:lachesin-like isoform X2 n=1 Tax=Planococcus citri TaxID=170843 RepID=UPI0031F74B24
MNAAMDVIFFLPFLWVISYVRSQTEPKILNISSYQYVSLEIKESVELSCIIQNNSGYTLSWNRKVNSTVEKISTNDTLNNVKNNKFAVNFDTNSTTPAYILTINGIEKSDFGTYICEISTGQNSISSKETKLELYVHPNFDNSTKNEVKVNEGSNFTIKCYADGNPMPTVTLKRYDTSSTAPIFSHPEHEWNIEKITKKDEGNYTCQADTSFGSVPWNIMILVISKPIFQNCTINLHYEPKFSAEFVCVINSVTNVTIFWFRNGKKLTNSKNVTMTSHRELDQKFHVVKLNISNVEKHGVYSVTVENDRGNATQTFSFSNDTDSLWLKDEGNYTSQANTSFGSDPWNITILVSSKLKWKEIGRR